MEAINIEVRRTIIRLKESGERLIDISQILKLSYRTVSNIWQRYKKKGRADLVCDYTKCGTQQAKRYMGVKSKCLDLKILHPRWGTPRLHVELVKLYPQEVIPSIRTLHSWYKKANLICPNHLEREPAIGRAKAVHNIWQVDAKERLRLPNEQNACYLTIVDEKSGACLEALVFPLSPY